MFNNGVNSKQIATFVTFGDASKVIKCTTIFPQDSWYHHAPVMYEHLPALYVHYFKFNRKLERKSHQIIYCLI